MHGNYPKRFFVSSQINEIVSKNRHARTVKVPLFGKQKMYGKACFLRVVLEFSRGILGGVRAPLHPTVDLPLIQRLQRNEKVLKWLVCG